MEAIVLIPVGALCITFIAVAFHHVSTHEKMDSTRISKLIKRKKNKK